MNEPSLPTTVWLNGEFLPAGQARIPVTDRSFLYGDGLFETVRVTGNRPFLWPEHLARLQSGADRLRIRLPQTLPELHALVAELLRRNSMPECLLRVHVSRGPGRRGYSPKGADSPTVLLSIHPVTPNAPDRPVTWTLATASLRMPTHDPLTSVKSANRLLHVLARAEAEERGADEALLLNDAGRVAEAGSGNVFWIAGGGLHTPPLEEGPLAGVTRQFVLRLAETLGLPAAERPGTREHLFAADGVFLTLSSLGVVPVTRLDGRELPSSSATRSIHEAYAAALARHGRD